MNFKELLKNYESQMIKDLCGLLSIKSVLEESPDTPGEPFGAGLRESLDYVLELGNRYGFRTLNVDNIAGHIEYGEGEEIIGVLCHVDVVPADGQWDYPPFAGTVAGDRIYGRGAVDNKGPTISSLYALRLLKDLNIAPDKKIRLIIGTDEESKWRGITRYFQVCPMPAFGFSPDADFPLIYGEKGVLHIKLTDKSGSVVTVKSGNRHNVVPAKAEASAGSGLEKEFLKYLSENALSGSAADGVLILNGRGAHAMEPDNGINAAVMMARFLHRHADSNLLRFVNDVLSDSRLKHAGLAFSDPEMKDLTCNLGILEITREGGFACLDFRYPIRWDKERFLESFKRLASEYGLTAEITFDIPVHYVDKDDPDIKILHEAYIKHTGDVSTPLKTIGGGTYARALRKGVAFGIHFPGNEEVVHRANEYIAIKDLLTATAIYAEALYRLACEK